MKGCHKWFGESNIVAKNVGSPISRLPNEQVVLFQYWNSQTLHNEEEQLWSTEVNNVSA